MLLDTTISPHRSAAYQLEFAADAPAIRPLGRLGKLFAIDFRSLAVFRIGFALLLLCDLWWRAADLSFFYSDDGVLTRADALRYQSPWAVSLHFANGTWEFQALLFILAACAHLALLVGYRTSAMTALSWLLVMSLHRRNDEVLQGGDNLIRVLAFWAMFVPLGAIWSVDSWHRPLRKSRPTSVLSIGSALLLLQIAAVYVFSALLKTGDAWQVNHLAIFYALNVDQLTTPFGRYLLGFPALLSFLTVAVLKLEMFGPALALSPVWNDRCRILALTLFLTFHLGLIATMELGPFPYVCILAWLLWVPTSAWNRLSASLSRRTYRVSAPTVQRDGRSTLFCGVQAFVLAIFFVNVICWNVRTLDFKKWAKYYPRSDNFILELVGLDQQWGMFSPFPLTWDGWYQIAGKTASGAVVNLSPGADPGDTLTDERPKNIAALYSTERWRKYLMGLASRTSSELRPYFARAVVVRWNTEHPEDPLRSLDIYYFEKDTSPEGTAPPQKVLLYHGTPL